MTPARTGSKQGRLSNGRFGSGMSGNPAGRPAGSVKATREVAIGHFHGKDAEGRVRGVHALDRLYEGDPRAYLQAIARYEPKPQSAPQEQGPTFNVSAFIGVIEQYERDKKQRELVADSSQADDPTDDEQVGNSVR